MSDSESGYYDFEFSVNFDRKCPIDGVVFYII